MNDAQFAVHDVDVLHSQARNFSPSKAEHGPDVRHRPEPAEFVDEPLELRSIEDLWFPSFHLRQFDGAARRLDDEVAVVGGTHDRSKGSVLAVNCFRRLLCRPLVDQLLHIHWSDLADETLLERRDQVATHNYFVARECGFSFAGVALQPVVRPVSEDHLRQARISPFATPDFGHLGVLESDRLALGGEALRNLTTVGIAKLDLIANS